jgi:hypothetical protein
MKTLRNLIVLLVALALSQSAMAWGGWGHHISAYIAEKHLTPEAKAKCEHYLQYSLPHYSSWMDHWRNSEPFKETTYWHMNRVDKNFNTIGNKILSRDAVTQLERVNKEMINGGYKNMSDSLVAVNLKFLIHMVGDMHCPCHVAYSKDCGLKGHSIYMKGKKVNRHKFWDGAPQYMHPKWKADRFVKAYDTYTPKEIKKICKGDAYKWSVQNANNILKTGNYWERGAEFTKLSKEQRKQIDETLHEQLAFAGYRLASTLNKIFSK